MGSSGVVKLVFVCIIVVAAPLTEAGITCGLVSENLAPCLGYLLNGKGPTLSCCKGVRTLKTMATTVEDRRTACRCMKSAAGSIGGLKYQYTAALPTKCGVSLPGAVGPQTDCSKVN